VGFGARAAAAVVVEKVEVKVVMEEEEAVEEDEDDEDEEDEEEKAAVVVVVVRSPPVKGAERDSAEKEEDLGVDIGACDGGWGCSQRGEPGAETWRGARGQRRRRIAARAAATGRSSAPAPSASPALVLGKFDVAEQHGERPTGARRSDQGGV